MGDGRLSNLSNLQWEKTDVWTLSNYQFVLLDMMAACAYMNSEILFFECFPIKDMKYILILSWKQYKNRSSNVNIFLLNMRTFDWMFLHRFSESEQEIYESKMLSTNLQWEKTDVWTLSNYQSMLLDMMAACAYMNSETLFFECFRECFFHTFCIYDNLRYRFNALWALKTVFLRGISHWMNAR
jgi:hypothetical protein